jgi:hypothetical protein
MANSKKGTAQVNPPGPKDRVKAAFGGKASLVDEIVSLIGGGSSDRSALMQVSNLRLMKHHHAAKRMSAQFGDKGSLVEAILAIRYGKRTPDEGVREKLETASAWRLMDLHRQTLDNEARRAKLAVVDARAKAVKAARRAKIRARRAAR